MIIWLFGMTALAAQAARPTQPPTVPPAAIAAPPVAPAIDPARLAAAGRLLDAMHIERQYDAMFTQMIPLMTAQLFGSLKDDVKVPVALRNELAKPDQAAEAQRLFAVATLNGFKARYPELKAATAREYAALFTGDELAQLAAFYESPVGQKTLIAMPQLQAKLFPIGMAAGRAVGQEALRKTLERMQLGPGKPAA